MFSHPGRHPFRVTLSVLLFSCLLLVSACVPAAPIPLSTQSSLYVFRSTPPALLEYDSNFNAARELPLNLPCPLTAAHAAPRGRYLALELECDTGPRVQVVDTTTSEIKTPFTDVDSHYLAWNLDGSLILRVDSLGNTRLMRVYPDGRMEQSFIAASAYDVDFSPDGQTVTYAFTRGLGFGSELWAATSTGLETWQLHIEPNSVITFARWSPDGKHIAFINMPDSSTPFPAGELWVMDADGREARRLAAADSGHGYAPAWSPDSTRIAYVGRENPDDASADQAASALVSNIYLVEAASGQTSRLARFNGMLVEAPAWSADGHFLAFTVVSKLDDTMTVWIADLVSGQVKPLEKEGSTCCPAWVRK